MAENKMKRIASIRAECGRRSSETPLEFLASNCALLVMVLFAFGFIFQNFVIPSPSMASTLLVGDHVLVDRLYSPLPRHGPPSSLPRRAPRRHYCLL